MSFQHHPPPWLFLGFCLLLAACLAAAPTRAGAAEGLRLNTDGAPPHSRPGGAGFEDRIVMEAFRRMDVPVRLVQLPSERALRNVDLGVDDGNYVRIAGLERLYPNLVMVPEPVSHFPFAVFTRDPGLKVSTWADLRGRKVAAVTGWKLVERNLADATDLKFVHDEEALFAMLDKGRAEVIIAGQHTGQEIIRKQGYLGIRALTPPLADPPMHIYLNKRHAALVPRLDETLRQMRRDGTIERLTRAGLGGGATGKAP